MTGDPFIPGNIVASPGPLARFWPRIPDGVTAAWLERNAPPGSLVLDPFGAAPEMAAEAARAGYRVLVAANNPLIRFLMEVLAHPSSAEEYQAALADLAAARRGDQRIEPIVRSLYATRCQSCGREVIADAFIWDRGEPAPFARIYTCPHCGDEGERPTTEEDQEKAASFSGRGLHQAWALEPLAPVNNPDRRHAQEAVSVYLPRALYALFTLINKLDGLSVPPARRRQMLALLVSAADRANNLWPYPGGRARPRQLSTPPRFYEHNIWRALEDAIQEWTLPGPPFSLTRWPEHPPAHGGVSLFEGRLRDLVTGLKKEPLRAVVLGLPRPSQAFWTLSAVWSAWLWGREALGDFRNVLRRRRYDWSWHATALSAGLKRLAPHLEIDTPVFGVSGEAEPGLLTAAAVAGDQAGLALAGIATRSELQQAQILWRRAELERQASAGGSGEAAIRQACREALLARGEPVDYLWLHTAALRALAAQGHLRSTKISPADTVPLVQTWIEGALTHLHGFRRFEGSPHSLEVGTWWLVEDAGGAVPLADRVEAAILDHLQKHPEARGYEIDQAICTQFPGLLTPEISLMQACIESYTEQLDDPGTRRLRPEESPEARQRDQAMITERLGRIASRLDYRVEGEAPFSWIGEEGETLKVFVRTTAEIGGILLSPDYEPRRGLIILPGGRANLVLFKLRRDPRLQTAVDAGWRFVKFRRIRRLAESTLLNRENMDDQFALDPLTYSEPQMPLL